MIHFINFLNGCCIYARCIDSSGKISVNLITAKSRVAPTKKLSLPKLELCGALTLAKLYQKIYPILQRFEYSLYCWTDSQIVLYWLKMHSATLSAFVCNRVSKVQDMTANATCRHVPTKINPADLVSRGCTEFNLIQRATIFGNDADTWPENSIKDVDMDEVQNEKRKSIFLVEVEGN